MTTSIPTIGDDLRRAMRGLAATVTVITAGRGDTRQAMAATSFSALSMDPPSILVCVNRTNLIHPLLERNAPFCVNILSTDHEPLAQACGRSDQRTARFEVGRFSDHSHGAPMLEDAQANLLCTVEALHDYGTHSIVIGLVNAVIQNGPARPLVYLDGRYLAA